jgi:hypothetical protein
MGGYVMFGGATAIITIDNSVSMQYNTSVPLERYSAGRADFLPVLSVGVIGSCAADVHEPRQVREEATVNGPLWVS